MSKPLILGFKRLPHAEKMTAKRAHNERLAVMFYADARVPAAIASMVAHMKSMARRNGVGPQPLYKRFSVERTAA